MPGMHATLSPSAAERWLSCPASVSLIEIESPTKEDDSAYAHEGTTAHALGELRARYVILNEMSMGEYSKAVERWRTKYEPTAEQVEEMMGHTKDYVQFLAAKVEETGGSLFLEQRLDSGLPSSWGTSDAVIVSEGRIEIVDLKYGQGVKVEAEGNPQLFLYGLGALRAFSLLGPVDEIAMTVFQPRLDHYSSVNMKPQDLLDWAESIRPIAEEALKGLPDARFGPSEEACRWCPMSGKCKAQLESVFKDETMLSTDPHTMSGEEIARYLDRIPALKQWLGAFEEAALSHAYSEGGHIPGWKVVLSGGQRRFEDRDGAIEKLKSLGFKDDDFSSVKLKGLGDLEALLGGKRGFEEVLGEFVRKTEGRPSLVPEKDRRKSITPQTEAKKVFEPMEEES